MFTKQRHYVKGTRVIGSNSISLLFNNFLALHAAVALIHLLRQEVLGRKGGSREILCKFALRFRYFLSFESLSVNRFEKNRSWNTYGGLLTGKRIVTSRSWRCCDGSEDKDDAVVPMLLETFPVFPNGADALRQLFWDLRRLGQLGQHRRDR